MTVHGSGLGLVAFTALGRMGQTGCEGTEWESETSLRCMASRTIAGSRQIAVTVGSSAGSSSTIASMDLPIVRLNRSEAITHNMRTLGGETLTIFGSALHDQGAYTAQGRLGFTSCELTDWISETELHCKISSGFFQTLSVRLTTGVRVGTLSEALSYDYPEVSDIFHRFYHHNENATANLPAAATRVITMVGSLFGDSKLTHAASLDGTTCEMTDWVSDSSLRCKATSKIGLSLTAALTIGARSAILSEALSYDSPMFSSFKRGNTASSGSHSITVYGQNLGLFSSSPSLQLGLTACEQSAWESDTSIACIISSVQGGSKRISMTAGMQLGSATHMFSNDLPLISITVRANRAQTGSASVTIHGANLGLVAFTAMGRVGQTGCEGTEWESETSVRCLVGHGARGTRRVVMTAGEREGA